MLEVLDKIIEKSRSSSKLQKTANKGEQTTKEQGCLNSGGNVSEEMCCKIPGDFPNTCLIGACGCAPNESHEIKICDCGAGKCFNGTECVPYRVNQTKTIKEVTNIQDPVLNLNTIIALIIGLIIVVLIIFFMRKK
ncbi:hypothetical protein MSIBF_A2360001 [groundwater metagenome]|uniref:Uncharacterized protein n=1 Tax=groundwater metagenome TaxID=717931 RepID=A0A098EAC4_9ZZZZ